MSGHLQREPVLVRFAKLRGALAMPEYLDHQGTGTVAMSVSLNTVLWRFITADQPPGIVDAIGKFKLPEPEVIVSLLLRAALTLAGANNGYVLWWLQVALQRDRIQAYLFGQTGCSDGRDTFAAGLGRTDDTGQQQGCKTRQPDGKHRGCNKYFKQTEPAIRGPQLVVPGPMTFPAFLMFEHDLRPPWPACYWCYLILQIKGRHR